MKIKKNIDFANQWHLLQDENLREETLKNYMLSLTAEEMDDFVFGNLGSIEDGLKRLIDKREMTENIKSSFLADFDETIKKLQPQVVLQKRA
jgi:predicted component of type VI protein secretion system